MTVTVTTVPQGVPAKGNFQAWWVTGVTDMSTLSVADLLDEATSLPIGCFLTEHFEADASEDTEEDDRACLLEPLETPGAAKWSISDITYVTDPQNPASVTNEATVRMPDGAEGLIVVRRGISSKILPSATPPQYVDIFSVTLGVQRPQPMTRGTKIRIKQKPFLSGGRLANHQLLAGA